MVTTCARLTECRVNGNNVNYIASSCDGDKKFIYYAPLSIVESDLPCLLNYIVEVDYDFMPHNQDCLNECNKECNEKCVGMDEHCLNRCYWQCDEECTKGSSSDLYSIANRMEFATNGQCPVYLDYL